MARNDERRDASFARKRRPALRQPRFALAVLLCLVTAPAHAEAIRIGAVAPLDGDLADVGVQVKLGVEAAVRDLNAGGGVLGRQVELLLDDDGCDDKRAVVVAKRMASEKVAFVAGHFCSGASIAAADVYQQEAILQITPTSTNPALTDAGHWNVFRICGRDDRQGIVAGKFLADHYRYVPIAIVHDGQAYSKGLADATKKALNAAGVNEALYATIEPGTEDFSGLIEELQAREIRIVYFGGYHPEAARLVVAMREQGLETGLFSGDSLVTEAFWTIAGEAGAGTLMTFAPDPRSNPQALDVVERFRADGVEPEGYVLYAYAAVQTWARAAELAGTIAPEPVAEALHANVFRTVLGEFTFDEKGDVSLPGYVVYEWRDGGYVPFSE